MTMALLDSGTRLAEPHHPKILIEGPSGIGKTSLLRSLPPELLSTVLLVDLEAGDLPIADLPLASVRPRTWEDCRNIACVLGGPDPARAPASPYSQSHYDTAIADSTLASLQRFSVVFVDSYTEASRRCRVWCEQQPEAFNAYGKRDTRAVFGLVGRELIGWTQQVQHSRTRTVVLVGILEKVIDDFGAPSWQIQLEGQIARRQLSATLDVAIAMVWVPFKDKPRRAFVCQSDTYPVKDRSGRLAPIEEPNLGKLLSKLST
jgi:AAA domain